MMEYNKYSVLISVFILDFGKITLRKWIMFFDQKDYSTIYI